MIVDGDGNDQDEDNELDRLVVSKDELSKQSKASKWFANPLFQSSLVNNNEVHDNNDNNNNNNNNNTSSVKKTKSVSEMRSKKRSLSDAVTSDEGDDREEHALDLVMPKTDKQLRKEQKKKDTERRERREHKQSRLLTELNEDRDGM